MLRTPIHNITFANAPTSTAARLRLSQDFLQNFVVFFCKILIKSDAILTPSSSFIPPISMNGTIRTYPKLGRITKALSIMIIYNRTPTTTLDCFIAPWGWLRHLFIMPVGFLMLPGAAVRTFHINSLENNHHTNRLCHLN